MSSPPPETSAKPSARRVTPATATAADYHDDSLQKRMSVEKGIVDELLLVCGVIGSTSINQEGVEEFIPVTDCLNWLQDLQRALRRDDDNFRPISLLLSNWKVVPQKLLPLIVSCKYDSSIVLTVVKILVILTKPLSETTKRAGKMVIDTKSRKLPESVIQEQIKLRENALKQSDMLMEMKRSIVHHRHFHTSNKETGGGLLSIFVSLLAEPLAKTGTARSDTDHLTIELVLHLFRNLLSAEPLLKSSIETKQASIKLHNELISLLEGELVLDIFLVIAQDMESRENAQYNLLMMELLHHLLRNQDPTTVARCMTTTARSKSEASIVDAISKENPKQQQPSGTLLARLRREKQKLRPANASMRHSHFGGTLVVNRPDGKRQYLSAATALGKSAAAATQQAKKRKNRKTDPFIGSGRTFASHTVASNTDNAADPTTIRAQRSIYTFCRRFLKDCYGSLMKSLKNEFRRDSQRLEEGDQVVFFRIVWFFCQWWRVAGKGRALVDASTDEPPDNPHNALGQLIFTIDVFTFNLVLNSTDVFAQLKKWTQLSQSVALYSEMMQLLQIMYNSKDSTEKIMALGLLDRLFYGSEPLDRLPRLFARWQPGTFSREYLCDLAELCHVTLKVLEANATACAEYVDDDAKKKKKSGDAVTRMKEAAARFDLPNYILRKLVSNQTVFMYTQLLSQYAVNAPHVNHRIIAFFLRMSRLKIAAPEDEDEGLPVNTQLALKTVTLEPMLYNIQLLIVLNEILNDQSIRNDKEYASLISFATSIVTRFAVQAQANPMLYVECLFRHPVPHRFCELSTNMYVDQELRMMELRNLLLEEHRREETQVEADRANEEEDDEGEFEVQFEEPSPSKGKKMDPEEKSESDSDSEGEPALKEKSESDSDSEGAAALKEDQDMDASAPEEDVEKGKAGKDHDMESSNPSEDAEKDGKEEAAKASPTKRTRDAEHRGPSEDEGDSADEAPAKKSRIKKPVLAESSEDEFDYDAVGKPSGGNASGESKRVVDDDDDED